MKSMAHVKVGDFVILDPKPESLVLLDEQLGKEFLETLESYKGKLVCEVRELPAYDRELLSVLLPQGVTLPSCWKVVYGESAGRHVIVLEKEFFVSAT